MMPLLRAALRDFFRVFRNMPNVALVAFTLLLGMDAVELALDGVSNLAASCVNLAGGFLLAPYCIAVHRFVILGEVAPHFPFAFGRRSGRFFVTGLLISLLGMAPALLLGTLFFAYFYIGIVPPHSWLVTAVAAALAIGAAIFVTRVIVLLPAIAVDAPGASLANAYRDTKGHTFGIFIAYAIAGTLLWLFRKLIVVTVGAVGALAGAEPSLFAHAVFVGSRVGMHVVTAVFAVLFMTFFVTLASHAFKLVADRIRVPAAI
jgi:hypothetical protein